MLGFLYMLVDFLHSWVTFKCCFLQGAVTHVGILSTGEKRQPATHAVSKTHTTTITTPKPSAGTRYNEAVCVLN